MQQPTQPVFATEVDVITYIHSPSFRLQGLEIVGQPTITKLVFHALTLEQEPMCLVELRGTFRSAPSPFFDHSPVREDQRQPVPFSHVQVMFDCQTGEIRGMRSVDEHPESGPPVFATEEDVRTYLSSGPFGVLRIQGEGIPMIESIELRGGRARVVLSGLFWFVAPHFVEQRQTEPTQSRVCAVFDCQTGGIIEAGFC